MTALSERLRRGWKPARFADAATLGAVGWLHHVFASTFLYAPMSLDERFFLYEGWAVGRGMIPYRDFQEFKPPVIFFANMLAIKLFGLDGMHYRYFFSLLSLTAFVTLAAALLTRRIGRLFVVATLAFFLAAFFDHGLHDSSINDAESPAVTFFVLGVGILLAKTRFVRLQQIAGGAVLALVPLTKEPMAPAVLAAWVSFLLLYKHDATEPRPGFRFAQRTIAAVLSVVLAWVAYMIVTRSLSWYFVQLKETIAYTKTFAAQVGRDSTLTGADAYLDTWRKLVDGMVNPARLGPILPLLAAALTLGGTRKKAGYAAAASFALALWAVTIGHLFWNHLFLMVVPTTIFVASIGMVFLAEHAHAHAPFARYLTVWWVVWALVAFGPRLQDERKQMGKLAPPPPPVSMDDVKLVQSKSKPNDRIWNLGDPLLYIYADRRNALRESDVIDSLIALHPGATDEERLLPEWHELETNPPKLVFYGDDEIQGYERKGRYIKALVTPFLTSHHYKQVTPKLWERPN